MNKQTIANWLEYATNHIKSDTPRLDAELLLAHYLGKNRAYLLAFADEPIADDVLPILADKIKQLATGYPLAYLLGKKSFWDMELTVTEDTLIPRADTETLIETCEQLLPADFTGNIIDLGTGSGAIAIALSRVFPNANITATDNSQAALSVAQQNAKEWQIAPIRFISANWFSPIATNKSTPNTDNYTDSLFPNHHFDIIVSNPPYIEENDEHLPHLTYEPITALTATDNGLADIKIIIQQSADKLKNGGYLLLEHGYNQGEEIRNYFTQFPHWQSIQTIKDLGSNDRVTIAQYFIQ